MKVSVLLPTYNRLPLLKRAIESYFNQDYQNKELIILDNGSTDGSFECIKSIGSLNNTEVKYLRRNFNCSTDIFNLLWGLVSGDAICVLCDDDYMPENSLSLRVEAMKDCDVVYGGWQTKTITGTHINSFDAFDSDIEKIEESENINFATMMWKSNIDIRFDEELPCLMDWKFKIECSRKHKMKAVKESVMNYTIHENMESIRLRNLNVYDAELKLMREKLNIK